MRRYERASTLLTSNQPVEDWGKLPGDAAAVIASFITGMCSSAEPKVSAPKRLSPRRRQPHGPGRQNQLAAQGIRSPLSCFPFGESRNQVWTEQERGIAGEQVWITLHLRVAELATDLKQIIVDVSGESVSFLQAASESR
jgi:hypothetical protein